MAATENTAIYSVTVNSMSVDLRKIEPGRPGYAKARKTVVLRQRDAIELYQRLKAGGKGFDGVYNFQFLDTAKTFALLRLESMEHAVQDNLDRVQAYDGSSKSSR